MDQFPKILVYGYGNPGRQDDGLGNEMVRKLESWINLEGIKGIDTDANYQLNIEDAEVISGYDLVVFVDASTEDIQDYILTGVTAETEVSFTTHAASPGYIVKLCRDLFNRAPEVLLLHIKGYEWEFKEGLSDQARINLKNAYLYLKQVLMNYLNSKIQP